MCGSFIREPSLASTAPAGSRADRGGGWRTAAGSTRRAQDFAVEFKSINSRGQKSPTDNIGIIRKSFLTKNPGKNPKSGLFFHFRSQKLNKLISSQTKVANFLLRAACGTLPLDMSPWVHVGTTMGGEKRPLWGHQSQGHLSSAASCCIYHT